jgi:RND family efflux transporter MFP subunit
MKSVISWVRALVLAVLVASADAAETSAQLDWSGQVTLAIPVTGVVETVTAYPGQQLKRGDLLAALNPTLYKAGVAEAKADVERLTQEEVDAKRELDRVKELYARTVSATSELDAAQLRHDRTKAALAAAQARLEKARRLLEETELRAPFDAIVLARMAEPGLVAASPCQPTPLFTVARAGELVAYMTLNPDQAARIRLGSKAEVQAGETRIKGQIRAISPQKDGKYRLEVALPREKGLMPGQQAKFQLP